MILKINYFDNVIKFNNIPSVEIENKKYFYRFIRDLYLITEGFVVNDISLYDDDYNELSFYNKLNIINNYFNFPFNSKKIITNIIKYVNELIDENDKVYITKQYSNIIKKYKNILNDSELPLIIDEEFNYDNIYKLFKISIEKSTNLIDNLFLLIDLNSTFKLNEIIVFVNLKQYLTNEELNELYKYSLYKSTNIMLVDSQKYDEKNEYINKLIIDKDLDEFMI